MISYRLLLALTALGLSDNPLRPSVAAGLAKHHDKLDLERDNPRVP